MSAPFDWETAELLAPGKYRRRYEAAPEPELPPLIERVDPAEVIGQNLHNYNRRNTIIGVAAIAAVGLIALLSSNGDKKPSDTPRATPPPVTAPNFVTTTTAVKSTDTFRYDYHGTSVICGVPADKHTVVEGDTLYDLAAAAFPGVSEAYMHWLLPTIDELNVDRGTVTDPNVLKAGSKVLTITNCKLYDWFTYPGGQSYVNVEDIAAHTFAEYDYDPKTDKWGDIVYCSGNDSYCAGLGYYPPTTMNRYPE